MHSPVSLDDLSGALRVPGKSSIATSSLSGPPWGRAPAGRLLFRVSTVSVAQIGKIPQI
jgi:hypothetical protein